MHTSTPEEAAYLRGRRYREALLAIGRPVLREARRTTLKQAVVLLPFSQSDPHSRVADALAEEYGTDRRTLRDDAQYAAAVDTIAMNCGGQARALILLGHPRLDRRTVGRISRTAPPRQRFEMGEAARGRRPLRGAAPVYDTVDFGEVISRLHRARGLVRMGLLVCRAAFAVAPPTQAESAGLAHKARTILADARQLAGGVRAAPEVAPDEDDLNAQRRKRRDARPRKSAPKKTSNQSAAGWLNQGHSFIHKSARELPTLLAEVSPTAQEQGKIESLVGLIVEDVEAILRAVGEPTPAFCR